MDITKQSIQRLVTRGSTVVDHLELDDATITFAEEVQQSIVSTSAAMSEMLEALESGLASMTIAVEALEALR